MQAPCRGVARMGAGLGCTVSLVIWEFWVDIPWVSPPKPAFLQLSVRAVSGENGKVLEMGVGAHRFSPLCSCR